MAEAEVVAAEAGKEVKEKKIPELKSPAVRLPDEIRGVIATYCAESGMSFSVRSCHLWVDHLKQLGKIPADMEVDMTPSRGGGWTKIKEENDGLKDQIAKLEAQLQKLAKGK